MVYKLVSINGVARLKLSEEFEKITLPDSKSIYRLYLKDPSFDVICQRDEQGPQENKPYQFVDSTKPKESLSFNPIKVELLNPLAFDGRNLTKSVKIKDHQQFIYQQLDHFDPAIITGTKPEKYHVYYSVELYKLVEELMAKARKK